MPTVFISHSSTSIRRAVRFKELMTGATPDLCVFLSSDWDSIRSGAIWVQEIETALATCNHFIALLTTEEDARSPWINYEIGFARGRGLLPRIFLFDSITPEQVPHPLRMLHLIRPGDTNRRNGDLAFMGVSDSANNFGALLYRRTDKIDESENA
jgi:hypothetical protein